LLEDRTVPAVALTYGGLGTALALNELRRGTTTITISEATPGFLRIELNGAVFDGGSTAAAPRAGL
jgi:hypothetical protein